MADVVTRDDRWRFLEVGCSLAAGRGNQLSDIDAGVGYGIELADLRGPSVLHSQHEGMASRRIIPIAGRRPALDFRRSEVRHRPIRLGDNPRVLPANRVLEAPIADMLRPATHVRFAPSDNPPRPLDPGHPRKCRYATPSQPFVRLQDRVR